MTDRSIHFYNHERIQLKSGEAPLARRLSAESFIFPTKGLLHYPHNLVPLKPRRALGSSG